MFRNIADLTDKDIQRLLKKLDYKELLFIMSNSNNEVKKSVLKNLSINAAEKVNKELDKADFSDLVDLDSFKEKIQKKLNEISKKTI